MINQGKGYKEAEKNGFDCFMFHDVDLILEKVRKYECNNNLECLQLCLETLHSYLEPVVEDDRCIYACQSENPRHYSGTRLT